MFLDKFIVTNKVKCLLDIGFRQALGLLGIFPMGLTTLLEVEVDLRFPNYFRSVRGILSILQEILHIVLRILERGR